MYRGWDREMWECGDMKKAFFFSREAGTASCEAHKFCDSIFFSNKNWPSLYAGNSYAYHSLIEKIEVSQS